VEKKVVDTSRGQALADEYQIKFLETSAKNNINVEEAFFSIARDIKSRLIDTTGPTPTEDIGRVTPGQQGNNPQGKKGCCG
jgi:Ras-related protein Rab-8A